VCYASSRKTIANAISCIRHPLIYKINSYYMNDDVFKLPIKILFKVPRLVVEIKQFRFYKLKDAMLYYNFRVCIPNLENINST